MKNNQHLQQPLAIDVISIQSQVIYGCVGNSAAIPTLEQRGFTVAGVPTVLLSNTPLYPTMYGGVISDEWFSGYLQGLEERQALKQARAIVLGYLGSPSQARILTQWLGKIRQNYPDIAIFIDPVMGDIDVGLYVDKGLALEYREHLCALATGLTPNHFELEFLLDCKIHTTEEAKEAAKSLLNTQTQWVIATSAVESEWIEGTMQYIVATHEGTVVKSHPYYHTDAKGTGDTFMASVIANLLSGLDVYQAAEQASQRVMEVIMRTRQAEVNELILID